MGMIDHLFRGANDPAVREWRVKSAATETFVYKWRNAAFYNKKLDFMTWAKVTWPEELGPIPDSEQECWNILDKYIRK